MSSPDFALPMRMSLLRCVLGSCSAALLMWGFSCSAVAQTVSTASSAEGKSRPPTLWYLGIAAHHNSPAFRGDIQTLEKSFSQIAPNFQTIKLDNGKPIAKNSWPPANPSNVAHTIRQIAPQLARNDLLVIVLSTHGDQKLLDFSTPAERWGITPLQMNEWLKPIAQQKIIFILLACYSGSWINELSAPSRIVITSSKWDQTSDGCGPKNKTTEFVKFWQQEFSPDLSLRQITTRAGFNLPSATQTPTFEAGEHMKPMARAKLKDWQLHMLSTPP